MVTFDCIATNAMPAFEGSSIPTSSNPQSSTPSKINSLRQQIQDKIGTSMVEKKPFDLISKPKTIEDFTKNSQKNIRIQGEKVPLSQLENPLTPVTKSANKNLKGSNGFKLGSKPNRRTNSMEDVCENKTPERSLSRERCKAPLPKRSNIFQI